MHFVKQSMKVLFFMVIATVSMASERDAMAKVMHFFIQKDYDNAYEASLLAAQQHNVEAQQMLGHLYKNGLGVPQDYQQSMRWYLKAAKQGSADAQFNLGRMYLYGLGTTQNDALAVGWLEKASQSGESRAYGILASMYEQGRGVPKNLSEAQALYLKDGSAWAQSRYQKIQAAPCRLHNHTQLFDVLLKCANRADFRKALSRYSIQQRYENDQSLGDVYVSDRLMQGAHELRMAYNDQGEFASAKFIFAGRWDTAMVSRVKAQMEQQFGMPTESYGQPTQGKVLYKWIFDDGIELNVYRGWPDATTYLSYIYPERRKALLQRSNVESNVMASTSTMALP